VFLTLQPILCKCVMSQYMRVFELFAEMSRPSVIIKLIVAVKWKNKKK
jgi:hypothetical protein